MATMNPKRKGFIWLALAFACASFIVATLVLGLGLYNAQSKVRRVVSFVLEQWQPLLTQLFIWSLGVIILTAYTVKSAIRARDKNKPSAAVIILGHVLVFVFGIYLTVVLGSLHNKRVMDDETLFIKTTYAIHAGRSEANPPNPEFVPQWLDHIQKTSSECCGIRSYDDWNTFWAPLPETYPKSCCLPTRKNCTNAEANITYPDILEMNIKIEKGCYSEIIRKVKEIVLMSRNFAITLTVFLGISLICVLALYTVVFYFRKTRRRDPNKDDSDEDRDEVAPRFDPADTEWGNLEFYIFSNGNQTKKNKAAKDDDRDPMGTYLKNRDFLQGKDDQNYQKKVLNTRKGLSDWFNEIQFRHSPQQQQAPIVEYRVDVLSPATVAPQAQQQQNRDFDPEPQQPATTNLRNKKPEIKLSISDTGGPPGIEQQFLNNEDFDLLQEEKEKRKKERKRRHRHRKDDNDIDMS